MYNHIFRPPEDQKQARESLEKLGFEVLVLSGKLLFCDEDKILKISDKKIRQGEEEKAEYESALKLYNYYKNKGLIS
ncbi:hypothetical protein LX95_01281 [Mesonia algae]|uniref:Uncharacterized protein n=1 Tax=Mesonia algae TaxID=213248 RepID=A0A2W7K1W2_9FLAO|nr:hypothetical protein [Mesonia algae]PZW41600.1 hypothetical protein LX95_01281 [Mesonia algae]